MKTLAVGNKKIHKMEDANILLEEVSGNLYLLVGTKWISETGFSLRNVSTIDRILIHELESQETK